MKCLVYILLVVPLLFVSCKTDTAFDNGSKIIIDNPTEKNCENLAVLGNLWGFLKYYHPEVASGNVNWDYELFRIMPKVIKSSSKENRNKIFLEWVNSLGEVNEDQNHAKLNKGIVKFMPDLKFIEDVNELGQELVMQLTKIKNAKRENENYHMTFIQGVGNPKFENEKPYADMIYPDAGFRLLSLYRYWNIIKYFYPYKNMIKENWNRVLAEFIPQFLNSKNSLEYRLAILRLIEKINDTHATVVGNDTILYKFMGKNIAPCKISFVENKSVVSEIYTEIDSAVTLKSGDVILQVNGENIDDIIKRKIPLYSASNFSAKMRNVLWNLLRSNDKSISVTFDRDGQILTDIINCYPFEKVYTLFFKAHKKSWQRIYNRIGYIYPGTIKNSELPEMMNSFKKSKGIIIDLRCYPSEFIVFTLGNYLMPLPNNFVKFTNTDFSFPGRFRFGFTLQVGTNNPDYYKGKVVIIINETTQSQAEYTAMAFRQAPDVNVIGSTTAGADGNVSMIPLPGGVVTAFTGIGVYYPDGTESQGVGIVPDIEIKPTINGIKRSDDELLNKAIEIINHGNVY